MRVECSGCRERCRSGRSVVDYDRGEGDGMWCNFFFLWVRRRRPRSRRGSPSAESGVNKRQPIYVRTYVRTYIRTYVRKYIRTYLPTYIQYIHTYIPTGLLSSMSSVFWIKKKNYSHKHLLLILKSPFQLLLQLSVLTFFHLTLISSPMSSNPYS